MAFTRVRKKCCMRYRYNGLLVWFLVAAPILADDRRTSECTTKYATKYPGSQGGRNESSLARVRRPRGGSLLAFSDLKDTLPAGIVKNRRGSFWLWKIPLLMAFVSFSSFRQMSHFLYGLVEWTSNNKWLPSTDEQINLQTNVVTQVVNGPVITSISVLFASLVSTTIANLHQRQVTIQQSLIHEVHHQRLLKALLDSSFAKACLSTTQQVQASALVQRHSDILFADTYSTAAERTDAHLYIESSLLELLQWCHSLRISQAVMKKTPHRSLSPISLISEVESLSNSIMGERANRWMALEAVHFPTAHYFTLTLLAVSIAISFLVATAQAEVLFRDPGLFSVRILWSVLMTAFAALGVVCYDLSSPFGGAYTVAAASYNNKSRI